MITVAEYKRQVEFMIDNFYEIVEQLGNEQQDVISDYNREQLSEGLTSDGKQIGDKLPYNFPKYFKGHKNHRQAMGLQTNFIDLKITGTFHDSIQAKVHKHHYKLFSTDDKGKVKALVFGGAGGGGSLCNCRSVRAGGFGEKIFGLTDQNRSMVQAHFKDEVIKFFKKRLNG